MGPLQGTHVLADGRIAEIPVLCDAEGRVITGEQVARPSVTPDVGGTPTRKVLKTTNAAASASQILGWRIMIAPGSQFEAGAGLAEHVGDTTFLKVGSDFTLTVDKDDEYSVYVVCVANVAYNNSAGTILPTGTSEANTRTAMTKLDFAAATKTLQFSVSDNYELPPSGSPLLRSMLTVEGRDHA